MENLPLNSLPKKSSFPRSALFGLIAVLLIIIAIPITIAINQSQRHPNSNASNPTPNITQLTTCGTSPLDIMLIIDKSGSMASSLGNTSTTKIQAAKAAATNFVNIISANTQNHIGLATFSTTATLNSLLTTDFSSVQTQINQINTSEGTCTQCGAITADQEIHTHGRTDIKKVAILLTDGMADKIFGNTDYASTTLAEASAITEIQNAHATDGTVYFTIGLGNRNGTGDSGIDEPFLQKIAAITGGSYYYSPSTDDLNQIYQSISQIIGKGTVSGKVFNDINKNGALDENDASLSAWTVDLKDSTGAVVISTATTDVNGNYQFTQLCNNSYSINEEVQNGWKQTSPLNPNYYTVTIANADIIPNKNFGNNQALCGVSCTKNSDCEQTTDACGFCNLTTSKCSMPITSTPTPSIPPSTTPQPTVCPTLGTVKNLKITCPNCISE